ncbi:MAG TPA: nucleotide exchange factor GrpE [Thermoanaerobaculia bacterium]|jgi:molecular chaperone GrpE|nr:nucleotide exchange factor GrpE [Thermoanaerobaculia bacterium]
MDENNGRPDDSDDAYVIEDTEGSVEEIEREMRETAEEAASEEVASEAPSADPAPAAQDDYRNRYVRAVADFDNFRKRTEREKADFSRYATASVLRDILPVLDNFDRALEHAEEGDDFHKGVLLIYKQLFDVLQRHGLKPIDAADVPFDPNIHEAVVRDEDPSVPNQTVAAILQKGYTLHDRLLRPALVKVAVGGPERA